MCCIIMPLLLIGSQSLALADMSAVVGSAVINASENLGASNP